MVRIKALRGFFDQQGQARNAGEELTVKKGFAKFLVETNKAVLLPGVEVVSVESMPTPPPQQVEAQPAQPQELSAAAAEAEEQPDRPRRRRT